MAKNTRKNRRFGGHLDLFHQGSRRLGPVATSLHCSASTAAALRDPPGHRQVRDNQLSN